MPDAAKRPYCLPRPRLVTLHEREFALEAIWLQEDQLMGSGVYMDDGMRLLTTALPNDVLEDALPFEYRGKTGVEGVRAFLRRF